MNLKEETEKIESKIENVEKEIGNVEKEIENVEKKIENVEKEIEDAGKEIENVEKRVEIVTYFLYCETVEQKQSWLQERFPSESTSFEMYTKYNEEALRAEKAHWLEEERALWEKKRALRQEKLQWMEEKVALRQKEARLHESLQGARAMTSEFASLSTNKHQVEKTVANQGSASTFSTNAATGFGFLPTLTRFDPTYYEGENSVHSRLVPTSQEVAAAPLLRLYGEKMGLQSWQETTPGGIQQQFLAVVDLYKGLEINGEQTLSSRGINHGIAAPSSYEDMHHRFGRNYLSCIILKGAEASVLPAVSQAAVTGTNFAMHLLKCGVSRSECIVPVIGCNGLSFVAGAIIVLDDSFPTYIPISKHLDLSDAQESQLASAYLTKASLHCEKLYNLIRSPLDHVPRSMNLVMDGMYFIKTLTKEVYQRGFGMFAEHNEDKCDIDRGVFHMIHALNMIYASHEARQFAEYPISIRTPDEASGQCYQIIYRDLTKLGYRIGTPNRMENEALFDQYVRALKHAIECIHRAGVIHVDLYVSNVMWRCDEASGGVDIKIIDWDASHCLNEKTFVENVKKALIEHLEYDRVHFGEKHDLMCLSVLSLEKDTYADAWRDLASNNKDMIDGAFRCLQLEYFASLE